MEKTQKKAGPASVFSRASKGSRGYWQEKKIQSTTLALFYFLLVLAVFLLGVISTGSRNNLLTIVAVLGVLPAARQAITAFLYHMYAGCPEERAEELAEAYQGDGGLFHMVFTAEKGYFAFDHMLVQDGEIHGLLCLSAPLWKGLFPGNTDKIQAAQSHIQHMLNQAGCGQTSCGKTFIRIYEQGESYRKSLEKFQVRFQNKEKKALEKGDLDLIRCLRDVSL